MRRFLPLVVAAIIILLGPPCARASDLNIDHIFGDKIGAWTVGYSDTLDGCLAAATYVDQTTIWLGLGGAQLGAYLVFTNPSWRWIEVGKQYPLALSTVPYANWEGKALAIERNREKGFLLAPIDLKFRYDIARADNIIVYVQQIQIANLSLNDSTGALLAAAECARERSAIAKRPPPPEQNVASYGTGFIVSSSATGGYILTNDHVVKGCSTVQISWEDETPHRGQVVAEDERNDLALILSDRTTRAPPAFRFGARIGDTVEVYGFPLAGILARGNFTVGNVSALSGIGGDTRMLQISAPVQAGNSGGPVLDQFGNIIGVVVGKLDALYAAERLKDLPQNVNFAIKAATAISFLEANNVHPRISESTDQISPTEIAERAKLFTAQVICRSTQQAERSPEPLPPPPPRPPVQNTLRLRVVQNLNLRVAPDPLSDRVILGAPPNDVIPKDAIVELRYTDLDVACRRYDAVGAGHAIWCPVIYAGHGGWVNALYLDTGNGRLSCAIDQTSRECNQTAQKSLSLRVVQNLTLRMAPDPHADKVIVGPPLNDAIPTSAVVELRYTDLKTDCRRYDVAGAVHTIWCPIIYAGHTGWANALYLATANGPLSCLIDQTSRACNQAAQALGPR